MYDYIFILDKVVYSRQDSMGWCIFKVTRDGKNMENESGIKAGQSYGSMSGDQSIKGGELYKNMNNDVN